MDDQSRPAVVAIAALALLTLCLCGVVVVGGYALTNQLAAQQQQIDALRATLAAPQPTNAAALASATATPAPPILPSPVPTGARAPSAVPSVPSTAAGTVSPAGSTTSARSVPTPSQRPVSELAQALVPEKRAALAANPRAPLYRIGARLDPQQRTIIGSESVVVPNAADGVISNLCIRLYGNAPFYGGGNAIQIGDVRLDGVSASVRVEQDNTLVRVPIANTLNTSFTLTLRFTTTVPTAGGGYGIFNVSDGVFALHYWHPELTAYNADGSCVLHPIAEQGDLHNTASSNYLITFAAPPSYEIITSGVEVNRSTSADGDALHEIVAPLTRNFVLVASDRLQQTSLTVGTVKVKSWYAGASTDAQGGRATLTAASRALELFSQQFSPYPYTEFDVVEINLSGGAAGVESTGLIMVASDLYDPAKADPLGNVGPIFGSSQAKLDLLGFVTAHETSHEWWYGVVGNDAFQQPWLDESLANWSASYYVDQTSGAESGLMTRDLLVRLPYLLVLLDHDERLDQPVDRFSGEEYAGIVYGKGALMYDVLRRQLGDAKFFEFLRRYEQAYEFKRADGDAWKQALAQVAGAETANAFYAKWVEGASVQESDLPPGGAIANVFNNPIARELLRSLMRQMQKK